MNQELAQSKATQIFHPIDLELSCDSYDEPTIAQQSRNKSIFRVPNDAAVSPPRVTRANPIQDEEMRECEDCNDRAAISPYPFSPSAEEIEERQNLMLGMDWREPFEESPRQEAIKSCSKTIGQTVDFSFYFENTPTDIQDVDSDVDDVSFIYEDESILEEKGFVLECVTPFIWDSVALSAPQSTEDAKFGYDPRFSPAQISVVSDSEQTSTPRSPSPLCLKK